MYQTGVHSSNWDAHTGPDYLVYLNHRVKYAESAWLFLYSRT